MELLEKRNELIIKHLNLAEKIASFRLKNASLKILSFDELKSAAYFGLISAAGNHVQSNYDINKFKTYASLRINGEITDYIRSFNQGSRYNPRYFVELDDVYESKNETSYDLFYKITSILSDRDKNIFFKFYFEGYELKEIEKEYKISLGVINGILVKSKNKIRKKWDKYELFSEIN